MSHYVEMEEGPRLFQVTVGDVTPKVGVRHEPISHAGGKEFAPDARWPVDREEDATHASLGGVSGSHDTMVIGDEFSQPGGPVLEIFHESEVAAQL